MKMVHIYELTKLNESFRKGITNLVLEIESCRQTEKNPAVQIIK